MGLLERFRPPAHALWHPPAPGVCRCTSHIDDLLSEDIPLADGTGHATVADLVAAGALTTFASAPDRLFVEDNAARQRRGPFHWRILCQGGLRPYLAPDAPIGLDDALFVQPGIERVWWRHGVEIAVGAPQLCSRGIQGSLVRALANPRLRESA